MPKRHHCLQTHARALRNPEYIKLGPPQASQVTPGKERSPRGDANSRPGLPGTLHKVSQETLTLVCDENSSITQAQSPALTDGTALGLYLEGSPSAQNITAKHTGSTTPSVPSSPVEVIRFIFPSATPPLARQAPAALENAWEEDLPRWWEIREPRCSHSSRSSPTARILLIPFQMSAENKKGQTLPRAHGGAALVSFGATPADISKELPH